jgi:hypothetical protein
MKKKPRRLCLESLEDRCVLSQTLPAQAHITIKIEDSPEQVTIKIQEDQQAQVKIEVKKPDTEPPKTEPKIILSVPINTEPPKVVPAESPKTVVPSVPTKTEPKVVLLVPNSEPKSESIEPKTESNMEPATVPTPEPPKVTPKAPATPAPSSTPFDFLTKGGNRSSRREYIKAFLKEFERMLEKARRIRVSASVAARSRGSAAATPRSSSSRVRPESVKVPRVKLLKELSPFFQAFRVDLNKFLDEKFKKVAHAKKLEPIKYWFRPKIEAASKIETKVEQKNDPQQRTTPLPAAAPEEVIDKIMSEEISEYTDTRWQRTIRTIGASVAVYTAILLAEDILLKKKKVTVSG